VSAVQKHFLWYQEFNLYNNDRKHWIQIRKEMKRKVLLRVQSNQV
jgi:hypothetical protein